MFGQTGIFEILEIGTNLRHLVHEAADNETLTRCARSDGMHGLLESAIQKLGNMEVPLSEVVRVLGLGEA